MHFCIKALTAGIFTFASFSNGALAVPASDITPQMAYEDTLIDNGAALNSLS
jgi:thiol:disulfide interchange protein DsbC